MELIGDLVLVLCIGVYGMNVSRAHYHWKVCYYPPLSLSLSLTLPLYFNANQLTRLTFNASQCLCDHNVKDKKETQEKCPKKVAIFFFLIEITKLSIHFPSYTQLFQKIIFTRIELLRIAITGHKQQITQTLEIGNSFICQVFKQNGLF